MLPHKKESGKNVTIYYHSSFRTASNKIGIHEWTEILYYVAHFTTKFESPLGWMALVLTGALTMYTPDIIIVISLLLINTRISSALVIRSSMNLIQQPTTSKRLQCNVAL